MKLNSGKQLSTQLLIIYMISTLLFLFSIDLHIHTKDAATSADHGSSVSITSLSNSLGGIDSSDEIEVSPDGMLKVPHNAPDMLVIFLLLALIIAIFGQVFVARIQNAHTRSTLPFFGTPALRAPPQ